MSDGPVQNTDRERELFFQAFDGIGRVAIMKGGAISIEVGGRVIVKSLRDWHALVTSPMKEETGRYGGLVERLTTEATNARSNAEERENVQFVDPHKAWTGIAQAFTEAAAAIASLEKALANAIRMKDGYRKHLHLCEQEAGKALCYPWYKDDLKNFPDATKADGVCIGEHVGDTIVAELASKYASQEAEVKELREALIGVMASLAAAISLLEHGGKKAAASDKMFAIMLDDYKKALRRARACTERKTG